MRNKSNQKTLIKCKLAVFPVVVNVGDDEVVLLDVVDISDCNGADSCLNEILTQSEKVSLIKSLVVSLIRNRIWLAS